jgi:hypothetical protein
MIGNWIYICCIFLIDWTKAKPDSQNLQAQPSVEQGANLQAQPPVEQRPSVSSFAAAFPDSDEESSGARSVVIPAKKDILVAFSTIIFAF